MGAQRAAAEDGTERLDHGDVVNLSAIDVHPARPARPHLPPTVCLARLRLQIIYFFSFYFRYELQNEEFWRAGD